MALAIFIFSHEDRERSTRVRDRLSRMLETAGHRLVAEASDADLIVSIGGDGTLLDAVSRWGDLALPFLGINSGRLGFLQEGDEEDLVDIADRLTTDQYESIDFPLLQTEVYQDDQEEPVFAATAFNDVVVERRDTRTVRFTIEIEGIDLGPVVADGFLVTNPAGSTAYALAAGGAVIAPAAPVIQLVILQPHPSRLTRPVPSPLIVPAGTVIKLRPDWRPDRSARLVIDGTEHELPAGSMVVIRRAADTVKLLGLGLHPFWQRLRDKFS